VVDLLEWKLCCLSIRTSYAKEVLMDRRINVSNVRNIRDGSMDYNYLMALLDLSYSDNNYGWLIHYIEMD